MTWIQCWLLLGNTPLFLEWLVDPLRGLLLNSPHRSRAVWEQRDFGEASRGIALAREEREEMLSAHHFGLRSLKWSGWKRKPPRTVFSPEAMGHVNGGGELAERDLICSWPRAWVCSGRKPSTVQRPHAGWHLDAEVSRGLLLAEKFQMTRHLSQYSAKPLWRCG